ncbi:ribonuclease P protein subunit p25-like protein [Homalodisca vitripennis]|uniref:ribonuclease P protein subunit p25-like protein n=1 Tax=Homalodisca vitripennis TaxID=197043 RepID=UPI001EEB61E7|nr:ribonuclease P protein subunit p25-like protein [Homalodisca vitripennis]XP_046678643.1 ribonuclease P protein subunit p25-like protein [Homalodisca vitripennis]
MDKYKKGKNVEEPLEKSQIPIPNLPEDFLWMHVNPGTKMRNVLEHALKEIETQKTVLWSGSGPAVGKVISCAEIMKRHHKLHQINKICFRKVKEYWDPLIEDLDPLVVIREQPTIHILLSKDPLDISLPGYQAPDTKANNQRKKQQNRPQQRRRIDPEKFEELGLRSSRTKGSKRKQFEGKGETAAATSQAPRPQSNWRSEQRGETSQGKVTPKGGQKSTKQPTVDNSVR